MRQVIFGALLLALALYGTTGSVQAAPTKAPTTTQARYATINRDLKRYRKVERELEGFSTEGGTLRVYYQGTQPMKMVAHFYGEGGEASNEYYFWQGSLFFFYRVRKDYDEPLSGKVIRQSETRAYFERGKLVRLLRDETPQLLTTEATRDLQKQTLNDTRTFLGMARGLKSQ